MNWKKKKKTHITWPARTIFGTPKQPILKEQRKTWSETKKNQALVAKHLTHEDTAATKAYTAEMKLMQTMNLRHNSTIHSEKQNTLKKIEKENEEKWE